MLYGFYMNMPLDMFYLYANLCYALQVFKVLSRRSHLVLGGLTLVTDSSPSSGAYSLWYIHCDSCSEESLESRTIGSLTVVCEREL